VLTAYEGLDIYTDFIIQFRFTSSLFDSFVYKVQYVFRKKSFPNNVAIYTGNPVTCFYTIILMVKMNRQLKVQTIKCIYYLFV